jgi:hypothetical protein
VRTNMSTAERSARGVLDEMRRTLIAAVHESVCGAPNGHGAMSDLSPLSGGKAEVGLRGRQVSF